MTETHPVLELERQVWEALRTADRATVVALLADDFLGVYPTGFAGRSDYLSNLEEGPTVADYSLERPLVQVYGDHTVLLAYEAHFRRTRGAAPEVMYVSSVWHHRDGRWVNLFSQDTPRGGPVP